MIRPFYNNYSVGACAHCGLNVDSPLFNQESPDVLFCCIGCKTVYTLLQTNGLDNFYKLKQEWTLRPLTNGVKIDSEKFEYLDSVEFKAEYVKDNSLDFYLEGIHCLGCLWLIEKLPELCENVVRVQLDMAKSVAHVTINQNGKFSQVAEKLNQFGYRPHPIKDESGQQILMKMEMRKNLIRIGVAGAAAGNIMLLSICIYAGLTGPLSHYFNFISLALSLPVIFYCAYPFYLNAWVAMKNRTINLDLPIVLAIFSGVSISIYHMVKGSAEHYFDSITAIIFLLLSSRFFFKSVQQRGIGSGHLTHFFRTESLKRWNSIKSIFEDIHYSLLKRDDIVKIGEGEMICADGIVIKGESEVNLSLLTGESNPVLIKPQDQVYSGTLNMGEEILVKVLATNLETKIGSILKKIINSNQAKTNIENFSDRVGKYYIYTTFLIGLLLVVYFSFLKNNFTEGFYRFFSLILISCPCVLGFAAPFTLSLSLSRAAKRGLMIKGENTLEKISEIKTIVLDKTGTLTFGNFAVEKVEELKQNPFPQDFTSYEEIITILEKKSKHLIASCLRSYFKSSPTNLSKLENIHEVFGKGVTAYFNNNLIEFTQIENSKQNYLCKELGLFINGELCYKVILSDKIRPESRNVISKLQKKFKLFLASGDNEHIVKDVAEKLGIPKDRSFGNLSPEDKYELLKKETKVMMVGDGGNDAYALSRSHVGVAVSGSMEMSLSVADVYLMNPGISSILELITISKETLKLVKRNLIISVGYNIIGGIFAILGLVTPLMAAVLMPVSAFCVFLSIVISNKKLRTIWNKV